MKKTQRQIAMTIAMQQGKVIPAKMVASSYFGNWIGSEFPRVCRKLVEDGLFFRDEKKEDGKYTVFYPTNKLFNLYK